MNFGDLNVGDWFVVSEPSRQNEVQLFTKVSPFQGKDQTFNAVSVRGKYDTVFGDNYQVKKVVFD